jgi:hypothetical protein
MLTACMNSSSSIACISSFAPIRLATKVETDCLLNSCCVATIGRSLQTTIDHVAGVNLTVPVVRYGIGLGKG